MLVVVSRVHVQHFLFEQDVAAKIVIAESSSSVLFISLYKWVKNKKAGSFFDFPAFWEAEGDRTLDPQNHNLML
jgi:hypothetical protein